VYRKGLYKGEDVLLL